MTTAQHIQHYLLTKSKGVININTDIANEIVSLVVTEYGGGKRAKAKLSRYNAVTGGYELIRAATTTDEYIKEQIIIALEKGPVEKCYLWECYNQAGEFEGKIYTINPSLF